jgi:hypothetical protein
MAEPENVVLHLLREMREEMRKLDAKLGGLGADLRSEMQSMRADIRSDMHSLRADVASDLLTLEKRVNDQFVALRRSVMEYHSTAVGHGLLYSELEERVRKLEQRLDMTPPETH